MEFFLGLLMTGVLQLDTCRDEYLKDKYAYINAPKLEKVFFESKLDQALFDKIELGYDKYLDVRYHAFINQKGLSDSILVVHYYDKYEITSSIVIDFKSSTTLGFKYKDSLVSVCELPSPVSTKSNVENIFSLKKNVHNPYHGIVNYENGFDIYAVHIVQSRGERLFYVSLEGLPRNHFVGDTFDLKKDSEWYTVKGLFESF